MILSGNKEAFASIVERHKDNVYNLAFKICGNREDAEEIAQDSFIKVYRSLKSFKGNIQPFAGIEQLLKTHLNTAFLYPLKVVKTGKAKINQIEKSMINRAQNIMKTRNLKYFYITYLLEEKSRDPNDIEVLFSLLEKNIFQAVI